MNDISLIIVGVLMFVFLIFIIIFSGLEYAYIASDKLTIELKRKQQTRRAQLLGSFFEFPERFWSGTVLGFYACLACFSFLTSMTTESLFKFFPAPLQELTYLKIVFDVFVISFILLFAIGFFAKRAFENNPEGKLITWSGFINFVSKLTSPFAKFCVVMSEFILKYLFNVRIGKKETIFERVNPNQFLRNSVQGHTNDNALNKELFEKALQLTTIKVRKCMIPRNEITALEINTLPKDLKKAFIQTKLSKIVIYEESIDNVLGYVHHIDMNRNPGTIKELLHPIPTVPETMNAIDLIHLFTKKRKSIAWVVDEFGGTAGFITMEDVLEEIFGDIRDEYDIDEFTEKQISDNEFVFSGRLKLDYLNTKYKLNFDSKHTETLSGYIIKNYTTLPKNKDRFIIDNYEFEVLLMSETKVETVKMKILYN